MKRPDWDVWFMRLAYVTAMRGSCTRKQVGALIVRDRDKRIISGGYNGAPRGMPDCFEAGCDLRMIDGKNSCVRTLHAESNALDLCGALAERHTMFTTVIPCRNCALRIIQHDIHRVVYHEYYESQGTKETEALFAAQVEITPPLYDASGQRRRQARVELVQLNVDARDVRPTYGDACVHPQRICDHSDHHG